MRSALLLFAFAVQSFAAGPLIFGLRGGAPFDTGNVLTNALSPVTTTRRFEVGPTVGVKLPLGFAVEGDALFRRETIGLPANPIFNASLHSDSWQFPVMLKYRGNGIIAPVFGAGVSFRHTNDLNNLPSYLLSGLLNGPSTSANTAGLVTGGGVRFRVGPMDITPEVRYTRWGGDPFSNSLLNVLPLAFSRNEVSFLVGVTF